MTLTFGPSAVCAVTLSARVIRQSRILVGGVTTSADCYSPRDRQGQGKYIDAQWLGGGLLNIKLIRPSGTRVGPAVKRAHPSGKAMEQAGVDFPRTGIAPKGKSARLSMPDLHLSYYDVRPVTAYIRALKRNCSSRDAAALPNGRLICSQSENNAYQRKAFQDNR